MVYMYMPTKMLLGLQFRCSNLKSVKQVFLVSDEQITFSTFWPWLAPVFGWLECRESSSSIQEICLPHGLSNNFVFRITSSENKFNVLFLRTSWGSVCRVRYISWLVQNIYIWNNYTWVNSRSVHPTHILGVGHLKFYNCLRGNPEAFGSPVVLVLHLIENANMTFFSYLFHLLLIKYESNEITLYFYIIIYWFYSCLSWSVS